MKDKKLYKAPGSMALIFLCLLLVPVMALPDNHPPGFDATAFAAITCPDDIVQDNDPGQCDAVVTYTPPANAYLKHGLSSGSVFPLGETFIQYNLNDNSDSCTFTVTVVDSEAPEFSSCPDDIMLSYDDGICQAIDYLLPEATDNCQLESITQTTGLPPGSVFPIGSTLNTFVAEDDAGNQSTCSFTVTVIGGNTTLLASDGSGSERLAPQGKLRYQRAFYLVTAGEMSLTDLEPGMEVNSIGFTIAVAQDVPTEGNMKVYLQNTTDTMSRIDDDWSVGTTATNSYDLVVADPGEYEWMVRAICSGNSDYSQTASFENDKLGSCNQPYNLETAAITASSATFSWELTDPSGADSVLLVYGISQSGELDSVYTTASSYAASGLEASTDYRWRVKSMCGTAFSPFTEVSFSTLGVDACEEPTALSPGTLTDTTAKVSWTAASGATRYELSYRRSGTSFWIPAIAFNTQYTFMNLEPGTRYEWRVRTVCPDGNGSFVTGPVVTTTGTPSCFTPEGLATSNISAGGATLTWWPVPGATSYEVSYRLKESISWDHAINGMTEVSNAAVTVPDTIGPYDIPFESGSAFTYTGEGLYIAWEYENPSGTLSLGNTSLCSGKNTVIKGVNGLDSAKYYLSFDGRTDTNSTTLPTTLRANSLRPETRLGSPAFQDSLAVSAVYAMGHVALPYGSPVTVSALVKNYDINAKTVPVTMDIYDAASGDLLHSESKDLALAGACGDIITFSGWYPKNFGMDSIVVSVPVMDDENAEGNNRAYYTVDVNPAFQGYDDSGPVLNGAGFGSGEGLILSKYSVEGCGKVNSAKIFLHWSARGNSLHAVILDASGTVLDVSESITPDSTMVNKYRSFYFPNTPELQGAEFYIGLAQRQNVSKPYYPVGTQWEGKDVRSGAYYRASLDGSGLTDHPYPGRLMIQAEILPSMPKPFISGSDVLCDGATNTLQAAARNVRYADKVLDVSSQYAAADFGAIQTLGSPDVYPAYGPDRHSWVGQLADLQREYIVLHFPDPAPINFIDIYQTLNPGAIDTVFVRDDQGELVEVFSATASSSVDESSVLSIEFGLTAYDVSEVRIALGSDSVAGHHGIDAVGIGQIEDPAAFTTYSWQPGGETTQSIDVGSPGIYHLTVTDANGCTLTDSLEVTSPVLTVPTISLSGPADFCVGDSVVLTSSEAEGNTWSTGQTTQSIAIYESGTYNVSYNNGCETGTSSDVVVTVNELPEVVITGGSMCQGSSTTLAVQGSFISYEWSTGATTPSITVNTPNTFRVYVTDNNGCEGMGAVTTFFAPSPNPVISGDPFFCPGDSSLLDAGAGYASYLWSNGKTSRKIYVKEPGTVSVTVTNVYGCSGSASVVSGEYVPPMPFISGALSLCYGSATILDAGEGFASYLWSTGEMTSSIVVDTADTFTVYVTDAHGCEGSASATTTLDGAIPGIPGPISGPESGVCQQTGLVYSIDPVLNTTHYVWTVPEGMTIVDGQGTTSITVDAGVVSTGKISVAASNTCGQSPTWNGRTLTVTGTPGAPPEIHGIAYGVCGLTLDYYIDDLFGTTEYTWTAPPGASIVSGNGTSEISVSFDPTFVSGAIKAVAENGCGAGQATQIMVSSDPQMPADVYGPAEVCRKQKNVAYAVDPVFNAQIYTWTVPLQATIKSGQGTPNIVVDFGNKSGNITVYTENNCGQSAVKSLPVEVVPCDNNGVAINTGDESGGLADNPYLNGSAYAFYPEVIANAGGFSSGRSYTLSWTIGEPVIETRQSEKMKITQGFHQSYYLILPLNNDELEMLFDVKVYPVPTRDLLNIKISTEAEKVDLLLELVDQIGEIVYREEVSTREYNHQLGLGGYPSNMLLLRVTDTQNHQRRLFKII